MAENLTYHLDEGDVVVFLSELITSYKHYFQIEKQLAEFLVIHYSQFNRFKMIGPAMAWIRDEEFTPHIRIDLENGFTPAIAAIYNSSNIDPIIYLKTIIPDNQINSMSRSQKMTSAWGTEPKHRSTADILSTIAAFFGKD